ncbi:MAG: hypothetical protein WA952_20385 [Lewinella sp.]
MKSFLLAVALFSFISLMGQSSASESGGEQIVIDNDKMTVVEFTGLPQGDVCGKGMHHHEPHLTVILTDATVQMTSKDGESQEVEVPAGSSIWFGAETHSVINTGDEPTKMILVYPKE